MHRSQWQTMNYRQAINKHVAETGDSRSQDKFSKYVLNKPLNSNSCILSGQQELEVSWGCMIRTTGGEVLHLSFWLKTETVVILALSAPSNNARAYFDPE